MYRVKMGLAQLGLSIAKMKTARRKQLYDYDAFPTTEGSNRAEGPWVIRPFNFQLKIKN